jgi:hypothetical protein
MLLFQFVELVRDGAGPILGYTCGIELFCKDVVLLVVTLLPLSGSTRSLVSDAIQVSFPGSF